MENIRRALGLVTPVFALLTISIGATSIAQEAPTPEQLAAMAERAAPTFYSV